MEQELTVEMRESEGSEERSGLQASVTAFTAGDLLHPRRCGWLGKTTHQR